MRLILGLLFALAVGLGALYASTDGFTALTAEDARRAAVAQRPRLLPDVRLLDSAGHEVALDDDLRRDGRVAIVNFFYTRCISLCLAQGSLTERLQQAIVAEGLQRAIRLVSISFDPRDDAPDLARYAQRMGADAGIWQFFALADPARAPALLGAFGIVVVPAPLGEFEHNAAFHVVTPAGRLARIVDLDEPGLALRAARALASVPAAPMAGAAGLAHAAIPAGRHP